MSLAWLPSSKHLDDSHLVALRISHAPLLGGFILALMRIVPLLLTAVMTTIKKALFVVACSPLTWGESSTIQLYDDLLIVVLLLLFTCSPFNRGVAFVILHCSRLPLCV